MPKAIESSLKLFRKKGQPHLFDAIRAVVEEALRPMQNQKRIIVVISDGLDRGSKATFEQTLAELQSENIMVYAVQAVDRTRGAIRRDVPKPKVVIDKLAEGTGGQIFSIDEPSVAAKAICDELRQNRYVLSYVPSSAPFGQARSLLVLGNQGITIRAKSMQQPTSPQLRNLNLFKLWQLIQPRVEVEQSRHYQQNQALHEDKETQRRKCPSSSVNELE